MRNKKGFTLIELLAVFVIMFMILGLAIYSFTKIRKAKQKESWETVKSEVESAAVEYFNANAWTQEAIGDNSTAEVYITVGKLVEEDYLSPVTNPMTQTLVPACTKINIKKNGRNFTAKYSESDEVAAADACEMNNVLSITPVGATPLKLTYHDDDHKDSELNLENGTKWIYSGNKNPYIKVEKETGVALKSITTPDNIVHDGVTYNYAITSEGVFTNIKFIGKNKAGEESYIYTTYKYDKTAPSIQSFSGTGHDFAGSKKVDVSISIRESLSGLKSANILNQNRMSILNNDDTLWSGSFEYTYSGNYSKTSITPMDLPIVLVDNAGNKNEINKTYNLYKLCTETELKRTGNWGACQCINNEGKKSRNYTDQYYDKYVTTEKCGDPTTGTEETSCVVDNCGEAPTVNIKIYKRNSSGGNWGSAIYDKNFKGTDNVGGFDRWWRDDSSDSDHHAPYGFNIVFKSVDYNLTNSYMIYNKTGLRLNESETNLKSGSGSAYKGTGNYGAKNKGIEVSSYLSGEGARRAYMVFTANGKTTDVMLKLNMDRTAPKINNFKVSSNNNNYNTQKAKVEMSFSDSVSGIRKVTSNMKNSKNETSWTKDYVTSWAPTYNSEVSSSFNGASITPKVTVKDGAGNVSTKTDDKYTVYKSIKCRVEKTTKACKSSANNAIAGQIKIICNKPVRGVTVKYKYDTNGCGCQVTTTSYMNNDSWSHTYEPSSGHNAAVFNFRGCCGTYKLDYANFTVKDWLGYTETYKVSNWKTGANGKSSGSCNPDRGRRTISY